MQLVSFSFGVAKIKSAGKFFKTLLDFTLEYVRFSFESKNDNNFNKHLLDEIERHL